MYWLVEPACPGKAPVLDAQMASSGSHFSSNPLLCLAQSRFYSHCGSLQGGKSPPPHALPHLGALDLQGRSLVLTMQKEKDPPSPNTQIIPEVNQSLRPEEQAL